jgi:hypothetical protein
MNEHAVSHCCATTEIGGEGCRRRPGWSIRECLTDARLNAQILSYSRSKGAFAGLN